MPRTRTQAHDNGSEEELEEKPIVPSVAMRASLAKFSFRGATTTPPKSKVAGISLSQPVPATTPTRGMKRKLSELLPDSDPQRPTEARAPTASKSPSSSRQGTPNVRKQNPGYAPPETYAHLNQLGDHVKPNLDILFCGIKQVTADSLHVGQALTSSELPVPELGLTDTLLDPSEDWTMPKRYNLGLTNMVDRPSSTASELSRAEKVAGVPAFLRKVARYRPRIVCFIGREIGDAFEAAVRQALKPSGATSSRTGSTKKKSTAKPRSIAATSDTEASTPVPNVLDRKAADYVTPLLTTPGFGLLPYKLVHAHTEPYEADPLVSETLFFTAPSTSGRVQSYQLEDRVQLLRVLREEKDAILSGVNDTSDMITIPPTLYEVDGTRTKSRFFIRRGNTETAVV